MHFLKNRKFLTFSTLSNINITTKTSYWGIATSDTTTTNMQFWCIWMYYYCLKKKFCYTSVIRAILSIVIHHSVMTQGYQIFASNGAGVLINGRIARKQAWLPQLFIVYFVNTIYQVYHTYHDWSDFLYLMVENGQKYLHIKNSISEKNGRNRNDCNYKN